MSDFQILLDETTDLEIKLEIQGASTKNLKTRLVIETGDGFAISFDGDTNLKGDSTVFHIPILAQMIVAGEYKCSVEAVIEGGHYVEVAQTTLEARQPVKVKASWEANKLAPVKDFSDVKASVEVIQPVEIVLEEKQDEVDAAIADEFTMQKSIAVWDEEVKASGGDGFEVKDLAMSLTAADDEQGTFEGYGSVFNNMDGAGDIIKNGSFKRTLNNSSNIKMLWQHDKTKPIGVYTEAYEDENGLYLKGQINLDTQQGREAYSLIKQGAVSGLSIGYQVRSASKRTRSGVRELTELQLHEVSIVTFPCNTLATIVGIKEINSNINKSITSVGDNSVIEHLDEGSGATHSSTDSLNHLNSDVDNESKALGGRLDKLLNSYKT